MPAVGDLHQNKRALRLVGCSEPPMVGTRLPRRSRVVFRGKRGKGAWGPSAVAAGGAG